MAYPPSSARTAPPRGGPDAPPRTGPPGWPRPPEAVPAAWLDRPPGGARVTVAGLVLVRQRPGTAKGVIFVTLEDETGTVNVIVWRHVYERFRRAVIAGRMLRVTGRLQRESAVLHVIAEEIEDISAWLDMLLSPDGPGAVSSPDGPGAVSARPAGLVHDGCRAADQPGTTCGPDPGQRPAPRGAGAPRGTRPKDVR